MSQDNNPEQHCLNQVNFVLLLPLAKYEHVQWMNLPYYQTPCAAYGTPHTLKPRLPLIRPTPGHTFSLFWCNPKIRIAPAKCSGCLQCVEVKELTQCLKSDLVS